LLVEDSPVKKAKINPKNFDEQMKQPDEEERARI
jgi:hypothetical protein